MVAKTVLSSTRWCSTRAAFQLIGLAMTPGFPVALSPIISPNIVLYMDDWYCSRPSSSQVAARISCSTRRASVPGEGAVPIGAHRRTRSRPRASPIIAAPALRRNVEHFDGAVALVGDVCLAPVGQHRDARWCPPGRDLGDDAVIRGVDHRDRVAQVVCREEVTPVSRVRDVQRI